MYYHYSQKQLPLKSTFSLLHMQIDYVLLHKWYFPSFIFVLQFLQKNENFRKTRKILSGRQSRQRQGEMSLAVTLISVSFIITIIVIVVIQGSLKTYLAFLGLSRLFQACFRPIEGLFEIEKLHS